MQSTRKQIENIQASHWADEGLHTPGASSCQACSNDIVRLFEAADKQMTSKAQERLNITIAGLFFAILFALILAVVYRLIRWILGF